VHELLQALRSVVRIAAPGVAFKAEAIVAPRRLVGYLGMGRHEGKECDLAYHNVLMVLLWSALASRRVALMTHTLRAMPPTPPLAGWVTYVRCHDDIGWAITEEDAAAVGEDGYLHRRFLADFYVGAFPGSFARGAHFQPNPDTGDVRTSGSAASLAGLEQALASGDEVALELAIRRLLLLYAIAFAHGGLPLIYMGDELGLRNDHGYADDPARRDDNRWMHRPPMDWAAAERRHDQATVEGRLWAGLRRLVEARRATRAVHAQGATEPIWTGNDHVFGLVREHAGERLLVLASFAPERQAIHAGVAWDRGFAVEPAAANPDGRALRVDRDFVVLEPYQYLWVRG
jgi:amylosucrase